MRFRTQLLWTLAVQGLGAAAMLVAVLFLGTTLGPAEQGLFSRVKTELEFITALCLLGMPQAVFYFSTSKKLQRKQAYRVIAVVSSIALAAALLYAGFTRSEGLIYVVMFALATTAFVIHGMLRVLVLADSSTRSFNIVTAAPQIILLLLLMALVLLLGELTAPQVASVYLVALVIGASIAWMALGKAAPVAGTEASATPKELLNYGAAAWSVAALFGASNVLWLRHIEGSLSLTAVGIFTMGLALVQVILTPFNYALPLLFKRWMTNPLTNGALRPALWSGAVTLTLVVAVLGLTEFGPSLPWLAAYAQLDQLKWVFGAIAVAEVVLRVAAVAANTLGRPWTPALAEMARSLILIASLSWSGSATLLQPTLAWMFGAMTAVAVLLWKLRSTPGAAPHSAKTC